MGLPERTFAEMQHMLQNCSLEMDLPQMQTIFRKLNSTNNEIREPQIQSEDLDAAVVTIFNFLDRNQNQRMDFNELYAGLMLLIGANDESLTEEVAQITFRMFDINNDNQISFNELVHWFTTSYVIMDVFADNE